LTGHDAFDVQVKILEMPPGRASLYRTVEIADADVAALQKKLRICNLCPGLPFHLKGRRKRFKMSFYIFVIHAAKIIQNHITDKAGIAFTARRASIFDQGFSLFWSPALCPYLTCTFLPE